MAVLEVRPFIMKNAIVTLGTPGDDFAKAVSSAALTPAPGTADFTGLKPDAVFVFPTATLWTLDLAFAQDWSAETSLSRWLFDHAGEVVPFILNPDDQGVDGEVGQTSWAGEVAITEGAVGGDVNSVAVGTVSLGVVGRPVPTYTAGTPTP
jgi:hypothetical protein